VAWYYYVDYVSLNITIGHLKDILSSQSLSTVLKKLNLTKADIYLKVLHHQANKQNLDQNIFNKV